ncbi:MAG TPA: hypothetical protein DCE52_07380 [Rhodobacteraceae bacterium]|nr:hypothetical protein [Paracoccaceae bacterium]
MNRNSQESNSRRDSQRIAGLLNPHLLKKLDVDTALEENLVDPEQLIRAGRFDLFAKLPYAKLKRINADTDWGMRLYIEHMKVFNGLDEKDGSGKVGADTFIDSFNSVLNAVESSGLDASVSLVPIDQGNVVIDGSHRVAAALAWGSSVPTVSFDIEARSYDFAYFKRKGLGESWLDAMALELLSSKKNLFVALLFPAARGKREKAEALIRGCGEIYYNKEVTLNDHGAFNFIRQVYSCEPWVGDWRDGFKGGRKKAIRCFPSICPVQLYIFEADKLMDVRGLKKRVRDLYGVGNHSVHVTDTSQEAIDIGRLLLNENSVYFLNNARPQLMERFTPLLSQYKAWLYRESLNFEHFCIDGSAIMAAYGLRDARDLDFLHFGHEGIQTDIRGIDSHNDSLHHHMHSRDDILFNQENHFWYDGVKFASLNILREMKEVRGEEKDERDVGLINTITENSFVAPAVKRKHPCLGWYAKLKRRLKERRRRAKHGTPRIRKKIIGLVAGRNESARIAFCLQALSEYTDAIVYLDDCSEDDTVGVVQSIAESCCVERVICKSSWVRDEPGDRNKLLRAGRELGGTHFVVIDSDEAFTANCLDGNYLRRRILELKPGEQLALNWIQLWRSIYKYRDDDSVWSGRFKRCIFCDNGKAQYKSRFIHTSRVPKLKGRRYDLREGGVGLLHFQFVNWSNLKLKQRWYRYLELVREPSRPVEEINQKYAASVDESDIRLSDVPAEWLSGYPYFDESICDAPDLWRKNQIEEWEKKHGVSFFEGLD